MDLFYLINDLQNHINEPIEQKIFTVENIKKKENKLYKIQYFHH
jgi:hypothetical protein